VVDQIRDSLDEQHGPGTVELPSRTTLYRLLDTLSKDRYTFADWRAITDTGVQIDYRTYNSPEVRFCAGHSSGVTSKAGRWEEWEDLMVDGPPPEALSTALSGNTFLRDSKILCSCCA